MNFDGVEVKRLVEGNRIFEAKVVVLMAWLKNSFVRLHRYFSLASVCILYNRTPTFLVNIHAITSVVFR